MEITLEVYLNLKQQILDNQRGYPLYYLTNPAKATYTEYELDYSKGASYTCSDLDNHVERLREHRKRINEESRNEFQAKRIRGY